ncbi:MAG: insulinase family protein, partial [Coriobacteriia bacterium]|nr:insulinase family protein [Coriobacteriia bacterium]
KKPAQTRRLEPLGQTPKRLEIVEKATEQAHLVYGLPGLALGDDDRFAGAILDAALGGGMSSRLFQEIREKRGLAYAVYASTMSFQALGSFFVYVGTRPANLEEAVGLIRIELLRILEEGITAEELARMQEYLIGNMVLGMESTASRMMRLGRNAVSGVPLYSLDETIERYRSVTMADTQRVAERVLTGSPTLAVISPREAATLEGVLSGLLEDQNKGARNDQGIV